MNRLNIFVSSALSLLSLLALAAGPASATTLTDGAGAPLPTGTSITAVNEGATTMDSLIGKLTCGSSHIDGTTTNEGGGGVNVGINVKTLSWSSCESVYSVLKAGTLSIEANGGGNGILYSTGTEVTAETFGLHCIFTTSNTQLGILTGSSTTKGNMTLDVSATIPRTGGRGGAFCGSSSPWTGSYKFTVPSAVNIDGDDAGSTTVLTDGFGAQLKTGTVLTAENESNLALHLPNGELKCEVSHLGGKTTSDGGSGAAVSANVETLTWSKCNASVSVLAKGTLSIVATGSGNATLYSTGTELTVSYEGLHCIFKTSATKLGTITGSTTTKGSATLDLEASLPRTGGTSGSSCGASAQLTGSYKFTGPSTLNIDNKLPTSSTVLTDGFGAQLKTGSVLTAENESNVALDMPNGELKCEASHLGAKTTSDGGGGSTVIANVEDFTWSKCNATLAVLAKGTLTIKATSGGSAELVSTETELTVVFGGLHCVFRTNNTKLGTITGSATTKGSATLDIEATIPRTGGTSGSFCGGSAQWTGSYKFTSPGLLNID